MKLWGEKYLDFDYNEKGTMWTTFIAGLSSSFNFEVAYGNTSKSNEVINTYANTFIETNTANIRVGGKAILFSKGDTILLSMSFEFMKK